MMLSTRNIYHTIYNHGRYAPLSSCMMRSLSRLARAAALAAVAASDSSIADSPADADDEEDEDEVEVDDGTSCKSVC